MLISKNTNSKLVKFYSVNVDQPRRV